MAKFPSNLDDGGLWLPSDIFLNEVPSKRNQFQISLMDDLVAAGHFPALQNQPPKPAIYFQRLKPAVPDNTACRFPPKFGRRVPGCENGSSLVFYDPVYELRKQSPGITYPAGRCLETRNRVLQRQKFNPNQNRVCPFKPAGFGFSGDGVVKESSGTGVFHPRVMNSTIACREIKRKQCGISRKQKCHEMRQQRGIEGVKKQEECYYHLPPDMGLPQDWTY